METNRAEEHLQTIRTLMERSAVYRRALAPIMVWVGAVGLIGGFVGWIFHFLLGRGFIEFWSSMALVAIVGSFLLVRRQALKDSEPFWSPPTRRVAQALLPPLLVGAFFNAFTVSQLSGNENISMLLMPLWFLFYGCAAHAAGFFMVRGIKLFGWLFILVGCVFFATVVCTGWPFNSISPYLLMGLTFGGLHLVYGIYLYITEKGKNAA